MYQSSTNILKRITGNRKIVSNNLPPPINTLQLIQAKGSTTSAWTDTVQLSFDSPVQEGNRVIVMVNAESVPSVTDNAGGMYSTPVLQETLQGLTFSVFVSDVSEGNPTTITGSFESNLSSPSITILEVSGTPVLDASGVIDQETVENPVIIPYSSEDGGAVLICSGVNSGELSLTAVEPLFMETSDGGWRSHGWANIQSPIEDLEFNNSNPYAAAGIVWAVFKASQ